MISSEARGETAVAIGALLASFAAAYNAADARGLAALFDPDAVFVNIVAGRGDGPAAIEAMHAEAFGNHLRDTTIEFESIDNRMLAPSVAVVHVPWVVTAGPRAATPAGQRRTGMLILVLRQSGPSWRIAAAQNTQTAALPRR